MRDGNRVGRVYGECDPLTQAVVNAALDIACHSEAGNRKGVEDGVIEMILAVRDVASRGELRQVESELNQLLHLNSGNTRAKVNRRTQ